MKNRVFIYLLLLIIATFSCNTPKVLVVNHKAEAEQAELNGDYQKAATEWQNYFNQQDLAETEGASFAQAAKTAYEAGMTDQAIEWFDQARFKDYADAEMYLSLAEIYRKRDNLSKEITALEFYVDNFDKKNDTVNKRLFDIYFKNDMNEKALAVWDRLGPEATENESLIDKFFKLNKELENTEVADSLSLVLLKINPEHVKALEWNALKYYWKAENLYQSEMKKYEQNKTGLQYTFLRNALKKVTADFKKSLTYFDKLWEIDPGKKYASYISNIYVRFDNDEKVKYYRKFLDN